MQKKFAIILAALCVLVALRFALFKENSDLVQVSTLPNFKADPKPTSKERDTEFSTIDNEPSNSDSSSGSSLGKNNAAKPSPAEVFEQPNQIPFEVKNGIAIAYGDVLLGKLPSEDKGVERGVTLPERIKKWSTEVPYVIDPKLVRPKRVKDVIRYYQHNTSVPLVSYSGQQDFLVFTSGEENCLSHLGRVGGGQPIFLADDCGFKEITHEIMHAIGFIHEQSRVDRDQYIRINWDNIDERFQHQFAIAPEVYMDPIHGLPFDYRSIMLYSRAAFSRAPGLPTLESITKSAVDPESALSPGDLEKLNIMFGSNR